MSALLQQTIGNDHWMRANMHRVRAVLPQVWTPTDSPTLTRIGKGLREIGIAWETGPELSKTYQLFLRTGVLVQQGDKIKVAP
jgi:hypothetical protein